MHFSHHSVDHSPGALPGRPVSSPDGAGTDLPGVAPPVLVEDGDGTTLYSIGYQNTNLNKRMPRMVPIRRIIQIEGENFDDRIIDMCDVPWIRGTHLPSVLPWPVKYLREMDRNGLRQS